MKRFLIIGLFVALAGCANIHVDQRSCTHDCHANSYPAPGPALTGNGHIHSYYRLRTMNCVRDYYGAIHCGYTP